MKVEVSVTVDVWPRVSVTDREISILNPIFDMPKTNYCPVCNRRMKRIYHKSGPESRVTALGWQCPKHIFIQGYHPEDGPILMRFDSVPFSIIKDKWRQ